LTIEITVFSNDGERSLSKQIGLDQAGNLKTVTAPGIIYKGSARRFTFSALGDFIDLIATLKPSQAISIGQLKQGLPDEVRITTKSLQGEGITRSLDNFTFKDGEPGLALLDFDLKSMPPTVKATIDAAGGLWPAFEQAFPSVAAAACMTRASTSAGIFRSDTNKQFAGSGGMHVYLALANGAEVPQLLRAIRDLSWLKGLSWMTVGKAGQILERSIIDYVVGSPERLIYEGAPVLEPPLRQDAEARPRPKEAPTRTGQEPGKVGQERCPARVLPAGKRCTSVW
jgi:hypothetical protein